MTTTYRNLSRRTGHVSVARDTGRVVPAGLRFTAAATILSFLLTGASARPGGDADGSPELDMTKAVACLKIKGFEDYEELPDATLTRDEKLLVYFKPLNYAKERDKKTGVYRVHLTETARIRPHGKKTVLFEKQLLSYEAKTKTPPANVFLTNTIAIKGLKPGDYDLDIILRDELAKKAKSTQVLRFHVKPTAVAEKSAREAAEEPDDGGDDSDGADG